MGDRSAIVIRHGGSWLSTEDGGESYVGGSTRGLCVDRSTSYEQVVQLLYNTFNINRAEFNIRIRTLYMEGVQQVVTPADIMTDADFETFMIVNNAYINCGKGVCPMYMTVEHVNCPNPTTSNGALLCPQPIISSSGSNQPRCVFSGIPSNNEHTVEENLEGYEHLPQANVDEPIVERCNSPLQNHASLGQDYSDIQPQYDAMNTVFGLEPRTNNCDEGEANRTGDGRNIPCNRTGEGRNIPCNVQPQNAFGLEDRTTYGNEEESIHGTGATHHVPCSQVTPMAIASTSYRLAQLLPPMPPSITISDALSTFDDGYVCVGQIFRTKQELKTKLSLLAMKKQFQFKTARSTIDRYELRCINDSCKWRTRAIKTGGDPYFRVTRRDLDTMHTCVNDQLSDGHRQATSRVIALSVQDKFIDASRIYTPKNIRDDIHNEYGIRVSYSKAWRGKEEALKLVCGDPAESYKKLMLYCHVIRERNLGTITAMQLDDEGHFMYFFMSIGACIRGFVSVIRPVIAVDGTFLKSSFRGTLLVAAALDGNNQIYPLSFGVVDSENDASWEWFFVKLRQAIGSISDLVFISDRHPSIEKGISSVFPEAVHGFCTYHIAGNVKAKFNMRTRLVDPFKAGYFLAAKEYRQNKFNEYMDKLRIIHADAANYLEHDVGFHKWARSHFPSRRYDMMTTNIAESINALLKHARHLPITSMVEYIRCVLQRWFYERREAAVVKELYLTDAAQAAVNDHIELSRQSNVSEVNRNEFVVTTRGKQETVDLNARKCTCRRFDLQQLPCAHAIAVCRQVRLSYNELCSSYYKNESLLLAYSESIYPVGQENDWDVPSELRELIVKPPHGRKPSGRRRTQRKPSQGEDVIRKQCSRCHGMGHNRKTCRNPVHR